MTDSDNQPPSKRAREAAADLMHLDEEWSVAFEQAVRAGSEDDCEFVEAFAKFERTLLDEIKARVRGLKSRHAEPTWNTAIDEALAAIDTMGRE